MRVVYVTESLLPLVDGVSLTLGHLFDTLDASPVEFRVYSPFAPEADLPWADRVRHVASVKFPLYTDYRISVPWFQGVKREIEDFAPDLIHVTTPTPAAWWIRRWAARRGIPVVATFHTHFVSYFRYYRLRLLERLGWFLMRRFYRGCSVVYVPSGPIAEELLGQGIGPVEIWSRGVDSRRFSPHRRDPSLRARLGVDEETPLLLMVSRLVREKDLSDLVPMDRLLRERGLSFRLAFVGDGPMRAELEAALPEATFAGHQTGDALGRWYASADAFVFPSTTETFGNVVQEAMASGLPAVVADRGGPPGVIEPDVSGFVARANDPRHLADQVGRLLADPELRRRMGRAARRQAEERDWDRVNRSLLESYRRLVGGRDRSAEVREAV